MNILASKGNYDTIHTLLCARHGQEYTLEYNTNHFLYGTFIHTQRFGHS